MIIIKETEWINDVAFFGKNKGSEKHHKMEEGWFAFFPNLIGTISLGLSRRIRIGDVTLCILERRKLVKLHHAIQGR